ncbi:acyltransferase [Enterobacteriaceae bacterium BIT-l23]|uniref:acyltransferase family protein n=1 Tax=Jejubacter sp. L23 TaxID=3092086 RepID=UPI0015851FCA|nr:acyltransferase [Enterobacteriaceae bacterium BIT-l23]
MLLLFESVVFFGILLISVAVMSKALNVEIVNHKYQALDGLRGICAGLVAIFHIFWRAGGADDTFWSISYLGGHEIKRAVLMMGEVSVGIFFMLSGFLFFKKALNNTFDVKKFFISRALRIYPPVFISLIIIFVISAIINHGKITTSPYWFYQALPFINEYKGSVVNGLPINITNSGVFWTLVWEVRLYIAIPLLFLLMKIIPFKKSFITLLIISVIALSKFYFIDKSHAAFITYFLVGFLVATTEDKKIKYANVIAFIVLMAALFLTRQAYSPTTALYLLPFFYLVKNQANLFGILTSYPIKVIGISSFSIYLLHGIM